MSGPVGRAYAGLVQAGELKPDAAQARAVAALDRLAKELDPAKRGLLGQLFGRSRRGPLGVYLWGGVGRGKSMLMDLAFDHLAVTSKRRVHFHEFMLKVHQRLREARSSGAGDPIPPVAEAI